MLKYINYQLSDDDTLQLQAEKDVASAILNTTRQNIDAIKTYIPSLIDIVNNHKSERYSLFCNRSGELNLVEFSTGRTFYSEHVLQEVQQEVQSFISAANYIHLNTQGAKAGVETLPSEPDAVIVFGMGLGHHLHELVKRCQPRYLIVYEPELDFLISSLQVANWRELLEIIAFSNTRIFLQMGSAATGITEELKELLAFDGTLDKVYLYRHQFHPMMDNVFNFLHDHSGDFAALTNSGHQFTEYTDALDYVPERSGHVLANYAPEPADTAARQQLFERNLEVLRQYYPGVYKEIHLHKPKRWLLVQDKQQLNLLHTERQALLYGDQDYESEQLVEYFSNHPFKDDVILGLRSGGKLAQYTHFKAVTKMRPILEKTLIKKGVLPDTVESLIVFGIGLGRHIELLLQKHKVNKLYICEPNLDFFYASLFQTDWQAIVDKFSSGDQRLYLNLGGDGSQYFYDLMGQFYQVGAYSIADTYLMSSYYNKKMSSAIHELRSELAVVLALGEYFDHARYGIAHTYHSLSAGHRFMKLQKSDSAASSISKNLPVFVIGNGPSLDTLLPYLKEHQNNAVIVSCGTALRSLYRNGIRPDFHAEIEQNRATYDWITQVDDKDYLKQITLLSVNGIHPDSAALFKQTLLCMKEGEASTFVFNSGLTKRGIQIKQLAYAYPTVTNLVMNYFIQWGFRDYYLMGVDLGFVDINSHHSKFSAYYKEDGSQTYDYKSLHGGGPVVAGNFRPVVFTKKEFEVARKLMEQAISKAPERIEVYNCSDGAKIKGSLALPPENILLKPLQQPKSKLIEELVTLTFHPELSSYSDMIFHSFSMDALSDTLNRWQELVAVDVTDGVSARKLIREQWTLIRACGLLDKNLTFSLFYGSANYISGILTKIASGLDEDSFELLDNFNQIVQIWRDYLQEAAGSYLQDPLAFDQTHVPFLKKR